MSIALDRYDPIALGFQLRAATEVSHELIGHVLRKACLRLPLLGRNERTARLTRLIETEAWTEAALLLIELELPFWKIRRIAHDDGEWYCSLSQARGLPDWLDESVETRHQDLALALLSAFADAQAIRTMTATAATAIVPVVRDEPCTPVCCDNFR